jgi:hypothetical protein
MNERITELAEQALKEYNATYHNEAKIPEAYLKKFAELIVKECGEIAYKAYWDNPETVRGIHIKEKIKKHFGVEK